MTASQRGGCVADRSVDQHVLQTDDEDGHAVQGRKAQLASGRIGGNGKSDANPLEHMDPNNVLLPFLGRDQGGLAGEVDLDQHRESEQRREGDECMAGEFSWLR